jgi:Mn-containing catalase
LSAEEQTAVDAFILRGKSDPTRDPVTGADLGTLQQEATR